MGPLPNPPGKVTPQKKPPADALLLHAMLLMCGADGNFDNIVKTGCFQCADQVVVGAAELADDGRCDHGNDLLVGLMHGFQNINHLRTLDNCAEGA